MQKFYGLFSQRTPNASITDTTPPTLSGIGGVVANADGTFTVSWSAATDSTTPIRYNVYIAVGSVSAASLFVSSNIVKVVRGLSSNVSTLANQTTYIVNGQIYTFGVRAEDAVGNLNTNTAILTSTAIGSGNLASLFQTIAASLVTTESNLAADHLNFVSDHTNFQADPTAVS